MSRWAGSVAGGAAGRIGLQADDGRSRLGGDAGDTLGQFSQKFLDQRFTA